MWSLGICNSCGRPISESVIVVMNIQGGGQNKQGPWGMKLNTDKHSIRVTGSARLGILRATSPCLSHTLSGRLRVAGSSILVAVFPVLSTVLAPSGCSLEFTE
jgi:hypothetical protein